MTSDTQELQHYDRKSIYLHWLTAILVLGLWCVGQSIDWFPKGASRVYARSLHITFGAILGAIFLYRIFWRSTAGAKLPPASSGWPQLLAKTVHVALYVIVLGTIVLGFANAWIRGDNLFDLFRIPAFDPGNKELRENVEDIHALAANVVLIVAGVHAAAALVHHYVWKDQVLRRMLPSRK